MYGVMTLNMKALHKITFTNPKHKQISTVLHTLVGYILCPALPMVGLFDCESKILKHIAVAGIFFLVLIIYNGLTISIMILNKD